MVRGGGSVCLSSSGQLSKSGLEGSSAVLNEPTNIETRHITPYAHYFTLCVLVSYLVATLGVNTFFVGTELTLTMPQRISNPSDGSLKLRNVKSFDYFIQLYDYRTLRLIWPYRTYLRRVT